jgi:phenylalanyl-tRNA synthetase beta chain
VKLPYQWLTELVPVTGDAGAVASALARRGFEVASIENGAQPVIDFEITANRPDCLSVIGLAREASAAFDAPLQLPERTMPPAGQPQPLEVVIEDAELCPRYCAQVFEVRSSNPAPQWMRQRLEAAGVRSISAIVDVTNYVMLEMGQPTHAFDYAKLGGRALRIRRARAGETVRTLDGVDRTLQPEMLVIADAERPQAIGGVMGGASSEIGATTRLMVLESAYFKPASVRRTSKRLGLKTEASTRFERGADVNAAPAAIARAAALLQQIGAAQPVGPMLDRYPSPLPARTLALRASRIERVLGIAVPDADVPARLQPLGFLVSEGSPTEAPASQASSIGQRPSSIDHRPSTIDHRSWQVTVPSFRVDVLREIDLIEEIARHDGYAGLPATFPALDAPQLPPDARTLRDRLLRQVLTACGLSEAMTFAFIEAAAAAPFADAGTIVAVRNPLSEKFAVLRPSLLAGLVEAAAHNRRRQHEDVRLFEVGTRFSTAGESRAVAGVWCGAGTPGHWSAGRRDVDLYDLKGVVEAIAKAFGVELKFEPANVPYFVPGRAATVDFRVRSMSRRLGLIGQLLPSIAEARGFPAGEALYAFELESDALPAGQHGDDLRAESLPRFPSIVRDLSVLVDAALPAAAVRGTIRSSAPPTLVHAIEFDRYRGKGIPEGRVSLSLRLTFRSPERTLTDAEADDAMSAIVAALAAAHGATRR